MERGGGSLRCCQDMERGGGSLRCCRDMEVDGDSSRRCRNMERGGGSLRCCRDMELGGGSLRRCQDMERGGGSLRSCRGMELGGGSLRCCRDMEGRHAGGQDAAKQLNANSGHGVEAAEVASRLGWDSKGRLSLYRVPHMGGRDRPFSGTERRFLPIYYLDQSSPHKEDCHGFRSPAFHKGKGSRSHHSFHSYLGMTLSG